MGAAAQNLSDRLAYLGLRAVPAESAHDLGKWAMRHRLLAPGRYEFPPDKAPVLFGRRLPNPLGLAAGFDKNAEIVDEAMDYGFGFVEVGSVTYRGGPGNPRPRMFRLDAQTIMNRMGLNGDPADVVAERLARVGTPFFGVNIAKTHSPDILGDAAIEDICAAYRLVGRFGLYTALNVSCPNTREGRTFEDPGPLAELLAAIRAEQAAQAAPPEPTEPAAPPEGRLAPPLVVKLSPVLDPGDGAERGAGRAGCRLDEVLDVCEAAHVAGYVCCNTLPTDHPKFGRGGISGREVRSRAYRMVEFIKRRLDRPVIGCGGIFESQDLDGYLRRGCIAAQAYNGFVRGPLAGVRFAHRVLAGYERDLK